MHSNKTLQRLFLPAFAVIMFLVACSEDTARTSRDTTAPSSDVFPEDASRLPDAPEGDSVAGDPEIVEPVDVVPAPEDSGTAEDTLASDTLDDEVVDPPLGPPFAWAWRESHEVEVESPSMVELRNITHPEGFLSGPYAHVMNCLNQPGGLEANLSELGLDMDMTVALCLLEQTAQVNDEGNYLHIELPVNMLDPNDAFAEVQAYHHMTRIHAFLKDGFGFTELDRPLNCIVNLQVGLRMFGTAWMAIDNAMYLPEGSLEEIAGLIGVAPPVEGDAIVFFQGPTLDFAYDGSVVYHEYVHAAVGGSRLQGGRYDEYGPDMAPLALNEAHADYLPASMSGDPLLGRWALGKLGAARDLSVPRRCPDHLVGQSHNDGRIFASALWAIRDAVGAEITDALVMGALVGYHERTGFDEAANAVIAEAAARDGALAETVAGIFADHGLPGCDRVKRFERTGAFYVAGTRSTGVMAMREQAPAYVQVGFEIPEHVETDEGEQPVVAATFTWTRRQDSMDGLLGMFGGAPEDVELALALKVGGEAILWRYDDLAESDAQATVPVVREGMEYRVTFAGTCLSQPEHVFQLVGLSASQSLMDSFALELHTTLPENVPVESYDCP